ncbi:Gfo/Idh/MocA family protein [Candidatus Neomarinimicrobiota bacterium]
MMSHNVHTSQKICWGLIGCGDIAEKRVAPAFLELNSCELIAVNRADYDRAESFAQGFGAAKWYRHYEQLIADPEIDAVYIATPVNLHAEQTIAAAEAGKHVLCEKPMAMNVAECDWMIATGNSAGVKLGIAYYRHFYPVVLRAKELVDSGMIGEVMLAQINAFEWFNLKEGDPSYWRMVKEQAGGGPMFDFGCHRLEVLLHILGPIRTLKGLHGNVLFDRNMEDTTVTCYQFERGTLGTISVSHGAFEPQDTLDIFGSKGSIHIAVLNQGDLTLSISGHITNESHPPHHNLHLPLIEDFTESILNDREPKVSGHTGREVARLEEVLYSAR